MSEKEIQDLISNDDILRCTDGMTLEVLEKMREDCLKANSSLQTYSVQDELIKIVFDDLIPKLRLLAAQSSTEVMIPEAFSILMLDNDRCVGSDILSETAMRLYMRKMLVYLIRQRVETMKWYNVAECSLVKRQIEKFSKLEYANIGMTVEALHDKYTEVSGKIIVKFSFVFNLDQFVQNRKWLTAKLYRKDVFEKLVFHGSPSSRLVAKQIRMIENPAQQKIGLLRLSNRRNVEQLYCADETIAGPYGHDAMTGQENLVVMTLSCKKNDVLKHNAENELSNAKIVQMMRRTTRSFGPDMKCDISPSPVFGVECPQMFLNPIGIMNTKTVHETSMVNVCRDMHARFDSYFTLMYLDVERSKFLLHSKQSKFFEDMQRNAEHISNKCSYESVFRHRCQELWQFFDSKNIRLQQFAPVCKKILDWEDKVNYLAPSANDSSTLRLYLAELGNGRNSACEQKVDACISLANSEKIKIEFSIMTWRHMSLRCARAALNSNYVCKLIFVHNVKLYEQFTSVHNLSFSNQRTLNLLMLPKEGPLIFRNYFTQKEWYAHLPGQLNFEQMLQIAHMVMQAEYHRAREMEQDRYHNNPGIVPSVPWMRHGDCDKNNILKAWVETFHFVFEQMKDSVRWPPRVWKWSIDFVTAFCMQVVNYQVSDQSGHDIRKDDFVKHMLTPLIQKLPPITQQTIALHFIKTDVNLAVFLPITTADHFSTIIEHDRETILKFLSTDYRAMLHYITKTSTLTVQDCMNLAQRYLDSQNQYSMLSQQQDDVIVVEDVPEDAAAHKAKSQDAVKFMHSLITYLQTLDDSLKLTAARLHFTTIQIHEVCKKMNVELPLRQQKEVPELCKNFEEQCFDYELKRGRHMTVPLKIEQILASEIPVSDKNWFKSFYAKMSCTETSESELGKKRLLDLAHTLNHQFHYTDDLHFTFTPHERERYLILPLSVVRQKLAKKSNPQAGKKRKAGD